MKKKICFLTPYVLGGAPSQRFRFEQFLPFLTLNGFEFIFLPFFKQRTYKFTFKNSYFGTAYILLKAYLRRLIHLKHVAMCSFVFIHREAAPAGPPIIEYIIAKMLRKRIVYDFDDAIWLTDNSEESAFARLLRCRDKVKSIIKWSYKVSCGNRYLADYAGQFNAKVIINPTTINTALHLPTSLRKPGRKITIGWTGSHSTLKYLHDLIPTLQSLESKYDHVDFVIIADTDPGLSLRNYRFIPWNPDTEIVDLRQIDIGIMPLPDDAWTRGKCGFKALQYMAIGIPAVVSPVGVNKEIVEHGVAGYCCTTPAEWFSHLEYLILHPEKRAAMGKLGRKK